MKRFKIAAPLLLFLSSCGNENKEIPMDAQASFCTFESDGRDTVNIANCYGKRQGVWVPRHDNHLKDTVFYKDGKIDSLPSGWNIANNAQMCRSRKKS